MTYLCYVMGGRVAPGYRGVKSSLVSAKGYVQVYIINLPDHEGIKCALKATIILFLH